MSASHGDKCAAFAALHQRAGAFVIANAWDAGSARMFAAMGFEAIATSSGAAANTLGRLDGQVARDEALAMARRIAEAVDVPVSADLEKGFGDAPGDAADTIRLAAAAGLAGGSIEDSTGDPHRPQFDAALAAERIAAAAEAVRRLAVPFVLTARAENYLRGNPNLDDTIRRLQAYERAGADVLFAPALPDLAAVRAVCASVSKPVNFMVAMPDRSFSVAELEAAGVKRISLASSLYRAAMTGAYDAAREVKEHGTFGFLTRAMNVSAFMKR